MTTVLDNVTYGKSLAVAGRNHRAADARKVNLTAVSMAGDCERDPSRHLGKDIGIMRNRKNRKLRGHARQRGADVVPSLPEIPDSGNP